ncbi:MAG TPA: ABC transporter substrate-binding protein [Candidatus Dormibacteraeota bacterium]|nr:ABC transporter substrate-binding protein [Candidatus Dormibacteraeota bacterium]
MRAIQRLASLVMFGAALSAAVSPGAALAANPITAGSITNSPPMISYASDGTTLQGVIVDLAAAMSKELGRPIVFTSMPFSAILPAMEAKRIDIAFTLMNDTPAREQVIDFVDFFNLGTTILVKKGNPEHIESIESLCGKSLSTVQGSTQVTLVDETNVTCKATGKPPIQNLQYAQPAEARLQVQSGHVTAFLGNSPVMAYLAKNAEHGTLFDIVPGHEYQPVPLGIGVSKSDPQLRDALKAALDKIIADGTYGKILAKYGVEGGAVKAATINGGKNVKI